MSTKYLVRLIITGIRRGNRAIFILLKGTILYIYIVAGLILVYNSTTLEL